ncbi:glycoside hydrolase family 99-like domain-containing protein [Phenylobacterium sp. VNQ135]|uniref:glycoside hydrolase family 99-like domain-containing protein n=1 Tax=Phenylobacterium sp. VNQ135 TaxID=3400922 RepID=UPI003BFBCBED
MNILFVSHCNFTGNSAYHVGALCRQLKKLGHTTTVLVPDRAETAEEAGFGDLTVYTFADALATGPEAVTIERPDIIHAFTPRDHVARVARTLSARYDIPYVVHMEDNEEQIVADEVAGFDYAELRNMPAYASAAIIGIDHRSNPVGYREFVENAAGYTCLIDCLLEFAPAEAPNTVFWPGFEEEFLASRERRSEVRASLGIGADEFLLVYSGNVHASIVADIRSLYAAIALVRRRGHKVRLARTGWDYADLGLSDEAQTELGIIRLGFLPRAELPGVVGAADLLVQPGRPDLFNDYRFPSKLPEYLATGVPVVLPDSNIGKVLADGKEVIKLGSSDAYDIAAKIELILADPALARRIGAAGREFALANLTWSQAAQTVEQLYAAALKHSGGRDGTKQGTAAQPAPTELPVQLVAFYLPQFHPIPENDEWWGKGFTEWTNVVRAPRNFQLHDQPRLPTELGFYDLRVAETLHRQAKLAQEYGVGGFCFYYYWFDGDRLLETPLDLWLASGPDFPFCICWANEPWSRRWDGSDAEVLMPQSYGEGFAEKFILDVMPILKDPRYIRVNGAPLLMIYKASDLPDPHEAVATWRRIAKEHGIDRLHIVASQSFGIGDPRPYGMDAAVEFSPPHVGRRLVHPRHLLEVAPEHGIQVDPQFTGYLEDYIAVAADSIAAPQPDYTWYRGLFPRWDNTPRRKRAAHVLINESAKAYGYWLRHLVRDALARRTEKAPLIFVNAWNEWAEGAYLEPDDTYGRAWLEVTRTALLQGLLDFARAPTIDTERAFVESVSRLPRPRS